MILTYTTLNKREIFKIFAISIRFSYEYNIQISLYINYTHTYTHTHIYIHRNQYLTILILKHLTIPISTFETSCKYILGN